MLIPIAATSQIVAAVVNPVRNGPCLKIAAAPINPMPVITPAAILDKSVPFSNPR